MTDRTLVQSLPVVLVHEDRLELGGMHPTAHGSGTHSMLRPVVLMSEITLGSSPPREGDVVNIYSDGSHEHISRP